ncbi:hypothetical protein NC652_036030 [Populus alba x Populus x berolinensis]|nr:hypothetical protein NC652_036030 [Populus alba x Populus x berolinensis]
MTTFKPSIVFLGGNHIENYLAYELQCDNMHCYTTVTRNATYLTNWIAELLSAFVPHGGRRLRVSMDMIWDQFVNDANLYPPVTLQFCYEHTCIIYQVSPPDNFPRSSLEHFLNHDHVDFFGFEMLYKVQYLRQAYNLVVRNWFDIPCQACLANPTRYRNVANLSIQNMVSMDFSKQYIKPFNFLQSDWRSNILPIEKVIRNNRDLQTLNRNNHKKRQDNHIENLRRSDLLSGRFGGNGNIGDEKSNEELLDMITVAKYLEAEDLLELLSQAVADRIQIKNVEYMRKFFGIENDFTPEEEAKLCEEHSWAFEDVDEDY